ncbi:MAG: 1-deoxy-D-xylulose-5-phosphate reductoisomerase [Clostridium sp.]|nr:1-deoxy-D-xylulose-5-phosphate reductoisomerase [Clostridium sp.]MCI7444316.1 1-deoxy-D-xylulose-5-phosphate reductoisomerase [Clostridium sp.]
MKKISILGVTGSIGTQTLDVVRNSDDIKVVGISANSSTEKMKEIIKEFKPKYVAMMKKECAEELEKFCNENSIEIEIYSGMEGLIKISTLAEIDMVVTSVVGMIGLVPTMEAIKAKKDIALANKETLVVAGELVMKAAEENGVKILPVDSEHSAIYQSLRGNDLSTLKKIILTASGGPFRGKKEEELKNITLEEALNHPNWSMGKKITIDSATLMNKGLEVIEAHWLFNCDYDNIQVVVHPQSIIHSMVEYKDGAIIAELGSADMRLPIQYALNYTKRKKEVAKSIDFYEISKLTFEKPDMDTFKCLKIAYEVGKKGGLLPTVLNGANEVAVQLFLDRKIKFLEIAEIIENTIKEFEDECKKELNLDNIIALDKKVRNYVINKYN